MRVNYSYVSFFLVLVIWCLGSCKYDKHEELYGSNTCDTAVIKYEDIRPQFEQDCFGCHIAGNGTGVEFYDYSTLKNYAQKRRSLLIGVTNHTLGSPMPKGGGKWAECRVNKLKAWINQGMKKR